MGFGMDIEDNVVKVVSGSSKTTASITRRNGVLTLDFILLIASTFVPARSRSVCIYYASRTNACILRA